MLLTHSSIHQEAAQSRRKQITDDCSSNTRECSITATHTYTVNVHFPSPEPSSILYPCSALSLAHIAEGKVNLLKLLTPTTVHRFYTRLVRGQRCWGCSIHRMILIGPSTTPWGTPHHCMQGQLCPFWSELSVCLKTPHGGCRVNTVWVCVV